MRKVCLTALCLLLCVSLLCGCTSIQGNIVDAAPTLPPAQTNYEAPQDDSGLTHTESAALYLPATDGTRLLCEWETVTVEDGTHPADAIVRALLRYPGSDNVRSLSSYGSIYLAGAHPVTVSGSVCTVNLASPALQLSEEDLYTVSLAIAATVCALEDITHADILVADHAVAMDITGYLPMGLLTAHPGEQLDSLWTQLDSHKAELGTDPADTPLSTVAALYYPMLEGGVLAEATNLQCEGQSPVQLATALFSSLSTDAIYLENACDLPDINALMLS